MEEGIQRALAEANKQKTLGLSPTVLQEKCLDAMATCAANHHCTMIIDGTTATKILNINNWDLDRRPHFIEVLSMK